MPGISHHGERGSGASTMKLRRERASKTLSAAARRAPGLGSGSNTRSPCARWKSTGCMRTKAQFTTRSSVVVPPNWRSCSRSAVGPGVKRTRALPTKVASVGPISGALVNSVPSSSWSSKSGRRSAKSRTRNARGWCARWTRPSIWLTSCRDTIAQPARAPLDEQGPERHARRGLGGREQLDLGHEARVARPRGGTSQEGEDGLVAGERGSQRRLLHGAFLGPRELPQREPRLDVARLPGGLDAVEEGGHVGLEGASCPGASAARSDAASATVARRCREEGKDKGMASPEVSSRPQRPTWGAWGVLRTPQNKKGGPVSRRFEGRGWRVERKRKRKRKRETETE